MIRKLRVESVTLVASLVDDGLPRNRPALRAAGGYGDCWSRRTPKDRARLVTRLRPLTNEDTPAVKQLLHRLRPSDWIFGEQDNGSRLVESNLRFHALCAWAGWQDDDLRAMAWVVDEAGDGRTGVLRAVAQRGSFPPSPIWQVIQSSLRVCCGSDFEILEATPASGTTVDILKLQQLGFRRATPLGDRLESFLPSICQHDGASDYLSQGDVFDGLSAVELGDDDNSISCRTEMFAYAWKRGREKMEARIDWRRRYVAAVARNDWIVWCVVARELPFEIYYYIKNRGASSMQMRLGVRSGSSSPTQMIPAAGVRSGLIQIADPPRRLTAGATVDLELAGTLVSFRIRRFRRHFRQQPSVACLPESADCTGTPL